MSPRHFSSKYGPYFVGQTFTQHTENQEKKVIPIIGKITALLKFPRLKQDK
jgi:hypothetical protein